MEKLSTKHRLFVEAYDGDIVNSMRLAGYEGADAYLQTKGAELLANPTILDAIKERSRYLSKTVKLVASREERQAFWTALMRNEDPHAKENEKHLPIPLKDRIKASELLGKSEVDFVERVDVNHNLTISDIIQESYLLEDNGEGDLDFIEAEYTRLKSIKKEAEQPKDAEFREVSDPIKSSSDPIKSSSDPIKVEDFI